jgi:carotenoid cleavage dioxygenase
MNLRTGEAREEALDDLNVEFPLPDTLRYGEKTRFSYHQHIPEDGYTVEFHALVKYDHADGRRWRYDYEPGWCASESPFAPRHGAGPDAAEDDGYVVTIATHNGTFDSECWVFDAREVERGPLARIPLPSRVPSGFHAKWVPGARLWNGA